MRAHLQYAALLLIVAPLTGAAIAMLPAWTAALSRLILLLVRSMP
ncbi:hypothetical protein [Novosphingobium humi]|uniref:Uncharacterized protein n=1 Tax=Novosphingobium humi TaxID=2282397 RepID=A0ABY7TUY1_9SPHN|nr:hypothetical protein [Novosphingobium humi]WCT75929.1 hypothetical protein PQ457_08095 [Novosphingobium humi]